MKKVRLISVILIIQIIMGVLQFPIVSAAPTPELFAYRIMSRSTVLCIDNPIAYAFNERRDISDTTPYLEGNVAMVPVRFMAESFNAECKWESAEGGTFVVEQRNCIVIRFSAGKAVTADGVEVQSDVLPIIKDNVLYVPADVFANAMMLTYKKDADTGLLFFSRSSEAERHAMVDYKRDILPFFDEKYEVNEKKYLYVSLNGNDELGDGSIDNPFCSIERAKSEVRNLSKNQSGDIIVYIRGGNYHIDEPIRFTPEDSGKNGYKIIYTAYNDEKVTIEGTREVTGWKLYKGNIYVADLPGEYKADLVYEDGVMAVKARHPNRDVNEPRTGYLQSAGSKDIWYGMSWNKGDIPHIENTKDLEVFCWPGGTSGVWMWHSMVSSLAKFDQKNCRMTLNHKALYELGAGSKYYMMGAMEFLDQEGEFYHDTTAGKLYYIPYGYRLANRKITVPVTDTVISFEGDSQVETVRNIEVSNMELRNTKRTEKMESLKGDGYEECTGNGVFISFAENCSVINCDIHDVGGNVIFGKNYFSNIKIYGNKVHNSVASGIHFINPTVFQANNNVVSNNLVYSVGLLIGQGAGIAFYGGGDNFATHNKVFNIVRSAATLGNGQTGYNYIAYNDFSDCNVAAEDTGMIYTSNQLEGSGSTINNNFFHDSNAGFSGWSVIYNDEVSHGIRVQNNIITRMQTDGEDELGVYCAGIFSKGREIKIINNVVANSVVEPSHATFLLASSQQGVKSERYILERNISYNHGSKIYRVADLSERTMASADYNVFYNKGETDFTLTNTSVSTLDEWKKLYGGALDAHTIHENPQFVNEEKDDFRLNYNSPAKVLGIKTINQSNIGLKEDFAFADLNDEILRLFISREGYSDTLSSMNLKSGEFASLKVTARTENGYIKNPEKIYYSSDSPDVLQVNSDGKVTALAPGKAKITATVYDGDNTASIDLYAFVDDEIVDFKLEEDTYISEINKSRAILPVGITRFGQILSENDYDDIQLDVKDKDIANVDNSGNINVIQKGSTEVSAIASFNGKTMTTTSTIIGVTDFLSNIRIKLKSKSVESGEQIECEVVGVNSVGKEVEIDGYECSIVSEKEDVAKIQQTNSTKATLLATNAGKTQIKSTVVWHGRTFETTTALTVVAPSQLINNWKVSNYKNSAGYAIEDENGISIYSSGNDIFRAEDDLTFIYREESATDLTIETTVNVADIGENSNASSGVMLRQEDTANSYNVSLRYRPLAKSAIITWRDNAFPDSNYFSILDFEYSEPVKLRLQKKGDMVIASCMNSSGEWQIVNELKIPFTGTYMAGLTTISGDNALWFESRFEDVKIYEGAE